MWVEWLMAKNISWVRVAFNAKIKKIKIAHEIHDWRWKLHWVPMLFLNKMNLTSGHLVQLGACLCLPLAHEMYKFCHVSLFFGPWVNIGDWFSIDNSEPMFFKSDSYTPMFFTPTGTYSSMFFKLTRKTSLHTSLKQLFHPSQIPGVLLSFHTDAWNPMIGKVVWAEEQLFHVSYSLPLKSKWVINIAAAL